MAAFWCVFCSLSPPTCSCSSIPLPIAWYCFSSIEIYVWRWQIPSIWVAWNRLRTSSSVACGCTCNDRPFCDCIRLAWNVWFTWLVGTSTGGAMLASGIEAYGEFSDKIDDVSSESGLGRLGEFETGIVGCTVHEFVSGNRFNWCNWSLFPFFFERL